jgi:hypothetical protein
MRCYDEQHRRRSGRMKRRVHAAAEMGLSLRGIGGRLEAGIGALADKFRGAATLSVFRWVSKVARNAMISLNVRYKKPQRTNVRGV